MNVAGQSVLFPLCSILVLDILSFKSPVRQQFESNLVNFEFSAGGRGVIWGGSRKLRDANSQFPFHCVGAIGSILVLQNCSWSILVV